MADNIQNSNPIHRHAFIPLWNFIALPIGYIIAALIIFCLSRRTDAGYWADLRGERGRLLAQEWGDAVLVALILAVAIRSFILQPFRIPSTSMVPTLVIGDRLMVNKLSYGAVVPFTKVRLPGFSHPKRGDIIVFRSPEDRKKDFIKRLIGLSGEKIEIKFGDIYVNGQLVTDPVINNIYYYNSGTYGVVNKPITVPAGYYFVLGDNSGSSSDSRFWGFVPQNDVIGKAEFIYWPPRRIRFLQ